MEISGKVLREVEFRDRLRGYDTDEVDEFLEAVAMAVDEMRAELEQLTRRAERAERRAEEALSGQAMPPAAGSPRPAETVLDDDAIKRTLVLAQRTADLAVAEAREEAAGMVAEARERAETMKREAEELATRTREEAEAEARVRLGRLAEEKQRLQGELDALTRLVEGERSRIGQSLSAILQVVSSSLVLSDELAEYQRSRGAEAGGEAAASTAAARGAAVAERSAAPSLDGPSAEAEHLAGEQADSGVDEQGLATSGARERPAGEGGSPRDLALPDVEREIAEDAATALVLGERATPVAHPLTVEEDEEEALWERWAAGRDLEVTPAPSDFPTTRVRRLGPRPGAGPSA